MKRDVIELLICPDCRGELSWQIEEESSAEIEAAAARCSACSAVYQVKGGIGVFLTPDLPRDDMWAQVESKLGQFIRENPDIESQLMDGSVLEEAGWRVTIENERQGLARPTPSSTILAGARADRIPVAATKLNWATICAVSGQWSDR